MTSANDACSTAERGRNASASGTSAPSRNVQPSRWCRNAERAKNHGFCSCTMNAIPVTANASGHVSRHHLDLSRPCTRPSSAPPASISTSAHEPCAYMWIDELVKNAITGQSRTPIPNAIPGHRYLRHGRIRQTSCPTIASASRQSPTRRIPAANPQWTISACGSIVLLEVGEQRLRDDEREDQAGDGDEQRRLDQKPPHSLPARMQQRDAVRLQDAPDRPEGDGRRADQRDRARTLGAHGVGR